MLFEWLAWVAVVLLQGCILWAVVWFGVKTMATLAQVNAAIAEQTQAIRDLEAAMPGPPAATEEDLENVLKGIQDNTNLIREIDIPGKPLSAKTTHPIMPPQAPPKK
jgi:hypothetical protein